MFNIRKGKNMEKTQKNHQIHKNQEKKDTPSTLSSQYLVAGVPV